MATRAKSTSQPAARPRLRSSRAAHRRALAASILLALAALGCLVVGTWAWSMPPVQPVRVNDGVPVRVTATAWFDKGATLFLATGQPTPATSRVSCTVVHAGRTEDRSRPAAAWVGHRARDGVSLAPAVHVGSLDDGDVLRCDGAALEQAAAWLLPTSTGVRPVPLALVLAGIACLGLALATNPRVRGMTVFGR